MFRHLIRPILLLICIMMAAHCEASSRRYELINYSLELGKGIIRYLPTNNSSPKVKPIHIILINQHEPTMRLYKVESNTSSESGFFKVKQGQEDIYYTHSKMGTFGARNGRTYYGPEDTVINYSLYSRGVLGASGLMSNSMNTSSDSWTTTHDYSHSKITRFYELHDKPMFAIFSTRKTAFLLFDGNKLVRAALMKGDISNEDFLYGRKHSSTVYQHTITYREDDPDLPLAVVAEDKKFKIFEEVEFIKGEDGITAKSHILKDEYNKAYLFKGYWQLNLPITTLIVEKKGEVLWYGKFTYDSEGRILSAKKIDVKLNKMVGIASFTYEEDGSLKEIRYNTQDAGFFSLCVLPFSSLPGKTVSDLLITPAKFAGCNQTRSSSSQ